MTIPSLVARARWGRSIGVGSLSKVFGRWLAKGAVINARNSCRINSPAFFARFGKPVLCPKRVENAIKDQERVVATFSKFTRLPARPSISEISCILQVYTPHNNVSNATPGPRRRVARVG